MIEYFEQNNFLKSLYPKGISFEGDYISDMNFSYEGPSLLISIHTNTLPPNPPSKWGKFNFVRLELELLEIKDLEFIEWGLNNITESFKIIKDGDRYNIYIKGQDIDFKANARWITVKKISSYLG